jgi:hypothetical protein
VNWSRKNACYEHSAYSISAGLVYRKRTVVIIQTTKYHFYSLNVRIIRENSDIPSNIAYRVTDSDLRTRM